MDAKVGIRSSLVAVAAVWLVASAPAAPSGRSVAFGPNGDAVAGTSGQPVALSPTSLLVEAEGPDGVAGTADDVTLLVTGLGRTPVVTAIGTHHASTYSSRTQRLSATRAAMVSAGTDGVFGTADDALFVLDRLGSEDAVVPVAIGGLGDNQQFTPERLTSDRVVVPSLGADLLPDTADDEVVVVSGVSGAPSVLRLAAPFQRSGGRTRAIAVSPSAFLVASDGPDRKSSTADDLLYLFRASGSTFTRTDLAAPGLNRRAAGRSVRLDSGHALAVSAGADGKDSTADDEVLLVDTVLATVTRVPVPFAKNGAAAQPTVLGPGLAVIATMGADGVEGTADDAVAVLADLGGADAVSTVVVGATGDNNECRPVRLDGTSFAMVTFGADRAVGTPDDEITVVQGVGTVPLVQHVVVGAVAGGTTSAVVPISRGSVLVAGAGPDQVVGTPDDAVIVLTGIGGALSIARVPVGGALDSTDSFRYVPEVLGGGRAALLSSGADGVLGTGGDDQVRVIEGLTLGSSLRIDRLHASFARTPPAGRTRPARVALRGNLRLEDMDALAREDLTLSVGNASQTLPAGSLLPVRGGRVLAYADPEGALGIVRSLTVDRDRGTLRLVVRGADQDIATTPPGYVPVGFDLGDELVPELVAARPGRNGFSFRRVRGGD